MDRLLLRSCIDKKTIEIIYMSNKGLMTKRTISVKQVNEHTVYGYCHLRKGIRSFKKENILAVMPKRSKVEEGLI
ncbi:WYL domain-containing protein [Bacillus shivajii]|uniref:WYL domain-containing protein n=1 Tax=Bacillus shivajii TaxID=1983719 RepID=UPI001CFC3571|nr:WYL domain-containing protein [Bacillus shivajii]UCZ51910.1 WYL domain-containing protein [Bacillus shivajii]